MQTTRRDGDLRQVLRVAFPLIMASSGHALRLFADRVMLAQYSQTAIAAAMPAGLASFCLMCFFIGTAGYAGTFVAQYDGAGRPERTGPAVWQGLYVALAGGVLVGLTAPAARWLFTWMAHGPAVIEAQIVYFQVLVRFSVTGIMLAAINGFWSGRGKTAVVMGIEVFCAIANVILNRALIFGLWGFPELGILGAGLATGLSNLMGLLVALALFLSPGARARFGTYPRRTLDLPLMRRLLRFGSPAGVQFALELIAFNLFIVLLGRFGSMELEAANIAFSINALAFLPLIGLGMTVSILVGQGVGAGRIEAARRAVRSALILAFGYNAVLGLLFSAAPGWILSIFTRAGDAGQIETLRLAAIYMRFITAYLVFDGLYIIFSHAIRGAGDTRFAMQAGLVLAWGTLVSPAFIAYYAGASATILWIILVAHVMLAGLLFLWRYRTGRWVHMRVIEEDPVFEIEIQAERGI